LKSIESALLRQDGFELVELQALLLVSVATGIALPLIGASGARRLSTSELRMINDYLETQPLRPVPLFLGYSEVLGTKINVSECTLLPGTETTGLIEAVLELSSHRESPLIVDIGTGSGVVSVVVGIRLPKARIIAIDISAEALKVAAKNFHEHRLTDRVRWAQGAWLEPLDQFDLAGQADILVSNPPYVCSEAIEQLPLGFRKFAPRLAIDGGRDGMDGHRAIAASACRYLKPGGHLVLQTDSGQAHRVSDIVVAAGGFERPETLAGRCGGDRLVLAKKSQTIPPN
jgi:release factor glutamine methyltransferase